MRAADLIPSAFTHSNMKNLFGLVLFCCVQIAPSWAQTAVNNPVEVLRAPGWNAGVFVGGGDSFANTGAPSTQVFLIGGRFGRVLTHELGSSALRGSFEMAVDVIPLYEFWVGGNARYAGAIDPLVGKWNFTANKTVAPYGAVVGGVVFSTKDLPVPNSSQTNFTSGAELGLQWFRHPKNSWDFAVKIYHLSNASIGTLNPGINGTVMGIVGYTWR